MMSSNNQDSAELKKRESRAGTRRVTSLTAEQLERKRANDREAQRTIRQRTKEHIERLEHQVAELKAKGDQFDEVVRRNALLENEIRALRRQLAAATRSPGYQDMEDTYNQQQQQQQQQPGPMLPSPQYADILGMNPASRTPSVLSTSSQVSTAGEWPPYGTTRSPPECEASDTEYTARVEAWPFERPSQAPVPMSIPPPISSPLVGFNAQLTAHLPNSAYQAYPQVYQPSNANLGPGEGISSHDPRGTPYEPSQRAVSVLSDGHTAGYRSLELPTHYQQFVPQQPRNDYYDWVTRA